MCSLTTSLLLLPASLTITITHHHNNNNNNNNKSTIAPIYLAYYAIGTMLRALHEYSQLPYKSPYEAVFLFCRCRNEGSEGMNALWGQPHSWVRGHVGIGAGPDRSQSSIYDANIPHSSRDTLVTQQFWNTSLETSFTACTFPFSKYAFFNICSMLGTAEGTTIWSYFQRLPTWWGKWRQEEVIPSQGSLMLSVTTEPPRVMGVWASEKLFQNYPNDG